MHSLSIRFSHLLRLPRCEKLDRCCEVTIANGGEKLAAFNVDEDVNNTTRMARMKFVVRDGENRNCGEGFLVMMSVVSLSTKVEDIFLMGDILTFRVRISMSVLLGILFN